MTDRTTAKFTWLHGPHKTAVTDLDERAGRFAVLTPLGPRISRSVQLLTTVNNTAQAQLVSCELSRGVCVIQRVGVLLLRAEGESKAMTDRRDALS